MNYSVVPKPFASLGYTYDPAGFAAGTHCRSPAVRPAQVQRHRYYLVSIRFCVIGQTLLACFIFSGIRTFVKRRTKSKDSVWFIHLIWYEESFSADHLTNLAAWMLKIAGLTLECRSTASLLI
jgi:hypothetical protein